jgi:hypothetical protein
LHYPHARARAHTHTNTHTHTHTHRVIISFCILCTTKPTLIKYLQYSTVSRLAPPSQTISTAVRTADLAQNIDIYTTLYSYLSIQETPSST